MNIEEDLTSLKEIVAIRKERCHGFIESDSCLISTKRLETLLTAYEEKCKELKKEIQDDLDVRNRWGLTLQELEKEKEKNKEYTMKINNLISQIESAIDFMKTDKSKIKVDMYQQKEEAEIEFNKYALVVLKKMLQELLEGRK